MDQAGAPLIYVNTTFSKLTGYSSSACVGQNCRFLQGGDTNPETVQEISRAIANRTPIEACILNYRRDGQPFHNFLLVSPFRSRDGRDLFLGCQFKLKPKSLNIEEHLEAVDGLVQLMSPSVNAPWGSIVETLRMRSQAVKSLVNSYATARMN